MFIAVPEDKNKSLDTFKNQAKDCLHQVFSIVQDFVSDDLTLQHNKHKTRNWH